MSFKYFFCFNLMSGIRYPTGAGVGQGAGKQGKGSKYCQQYSVLIYFGCSNEKVNIMHLMFLSCYQYMGLVEQEARVGLDLVVMELVLVALVLVQEAMVQDLEVMGLAQVDMELDLEAMEAAEVLGVVLGVPEPSALEGLDLEVWEEEEEQALVELVEDMVVV